MNIFYLIRHLNINVLILRPKISKYNEAGRKEIFWVFFARFAKGNNLVFISQLKIELFHFPILQSNYSVGHVAVSRNQFFNFFMPDMNLLNTFITSSTYMYSIDQTQPTNRVNPN